MRVRAIVLSVVLVLSLVAFGAAGYDGDETGENVTDLGNNHDLATAQAIDEYETDGATETDITRLDMTVTVADSKADVGIEDQLTPTDLGNDFLRLEYREDAERTVRILIPSEYWTPYERETVESVSSDHTADYDVVRGGDYQAVTIRFDGPADVVLPAEWVSSFSYSNLERIDERINKSLGFTVRDDNSGWTYVDSENMTSGPGHEVGEPAGKVTVQYDATPDSPEETWINAPKGETLSDGIYYYQRDSENGSVYIVSKLDDPPEVRYSVDSTFADRLRGDVNELKNIRNKIDDLLGGDNLG